jgi:hypothetical protein
MAAITVYTATYVKLTGQRNNSDGDMLGHSSKGSPFGPLGVNEMIFWVSVWSFRG